MKFWDNKCRLSTVRRIGTFVVLFFVCRKRGKEKCQRQEWNLFIIIFLLAYFVSGRIAKYFAFRVVQPGDRPIFIIFAIQIFTVVVQVAFASIIGVFHGYGFTNNVVPDYMLTYCRNFVMALPVQLFLVGPVARLIFRSIFRREEK